MSLGKKGKPMFMRDKPAKIKQSEPQPSAHTASKISDHLSSLSDLRDADQRRLNELRDAEARRINDLATQKKTFDLELAHANKLASKTWWERLFER